MEQKVCGIICEYNPFHLGHKWQLDELKKQGFAVVCVMSGSFVQRAEPSILPKENRAMAAIENGADLVLELPFPFSSMGAEKFAEAGVTILEKCGIADFLAFGSECGDISLLSRTAEMLCAQDFEKQIMQILKADKALGYARARSIALKKSMGFDITSPNDILAVEYIKTLKKCGSQIVPLAMKRKSVGHAEAQNNGFASATFIRKLLADGDMENAQKFVPAVSAKSFNLARKADDDLLGYALQARVLSMGAQAISDIAEAKGCEHAIFNATLEMSRRGKASFEGVAQELCAKHLTDSKIRRMLLFTLMGVKTEDMQDMPLYTRVIASNSTGHLLLKRAKTSADPGFSLITGGAALADASDEAKRQFKRNALAESIIAPALKRIYKSEEI